MGEQRPIGIARILNDGESRFKHVPKMDRQSRAIPTIIARHREPVERTIERRFRYASDNEKRLCASITGPMSKVTTTPFSTITRPLITVYRAFCGAQKSVAATGSFKAPA